MFRSLMGSPRFAPLFWCQFFSAFNDNFLKNALVFLILFRLGAEGGAALVTLAAAVFIVPYFLLSGIGGELADRYDKARLAQNLKFKEIGAAGVAVAGYLLESLPVLFFALFLFGVIAALFGPIKYGILPDHLKREELPAGNALVEAATFLAILLGTIVGGLAAGRSGSGLAFVAMVIGFAILSWLASRYIPPTGEGAPHLAVDRNIFRSTGKLIRRAWSDTPIWRGTLMVSWFWMVGAVVLSLLPTLVRTTLGGTEAVITVYLALFSVGIAAGSVLASWLANGRIILLPTPIAALIMAGFMLDLGLTTIGGPAPMAEIGLGTFLHEGPGIRVGIDLLGMAVAGGLFIVPAFAAVQAWSTPDERARVIAAVNVISSGLMVAAALGVAVAQMRGISVSAIFLVMAALNLVAGVLILRFLPTSPIRDLLRLLFRTVYRLEVRGAENLKKGGPNPIIALNHVSFLDAPLALSLVDNDPVFAIDHRMAQHWWVRPFLKLTRAMPLDPSKPMATRTLIQAVKNGNPLIIFPEGRLTVTGSLMKVYDGAGLIADKSDAFVIPVKIDGIEQTFFTRLTSARVRRRWWPKITVTVLAPVKLTVSPELRGRHRRRAAGAALYEIMSDLVFKTAAIDRTIVEAVIDAAKKHGQNDLAVEDPMSGKLTYRRLLAAAAILGRKLMPLAPERGVVGVMLPNSNAIAVVTLGLMSAGRVPGMINFSAGPATILAASKAAEITTIVTARAFIEKGKLGDLIEAIKEKMAIVYVEDIRATVTLLDRLRGLFHAKRPLVERKPDDPAAIVFTSGSEGTPKGVVLSHKNILANAAQGAAILDFGRGDTLFSLLPVFHSFGLTIGFVFPLVSGVKVYFYPSPLHYRIIPELIYATNATLFLGTETFLAGYARTAHAYDFRSLRYIIAGAEPVKEATRRVYMEKFGLRILEGYGMTEASPAVAFNTPMFNRLGSVGRILPGVEVKLEPVPGIEDGGRLFIRGPNVMLGYLRTDRPGVIEPPDSGWHDTGDIVAIDREGFVAIKGRAKRFAKIGGEMISFAAVEALAAELWPDGISAVGALPDPRKGERLILVTTHDGASRSAFQVHAREKGATDLMVPAEIHVVVEVPVLGSGKVDFSAVAKLIKERFAGAPAPIVEESVDLPSLPPAPAVAPAPGSEQRLH
jgi:acyl-[acyl-carrier-protein]-phospholipid O-acyltransferase/long-chain-fatty-acid--[acyl-carrier-protein] ligase